MNVRPPRIRSGAARAALLCLGATIACGDDRPGVVRTLVDEDLREESVRVVGWDDRAVVLLDEAGIERRRTRDAVLAVIAPSVAPAGAWAAPSADALAGGTPVVVELVDGQRLLGSIGPWDSTELTLAAEAAGDADSVGLLPLGGAVEAVPLERIGRVLIDPWARPGPLSWAVEGEGVAEDELILANGDRVTGFLVDLGDVLRFDAGGGERDFPISRVSEIRLGNPIEASAGARVWWASGEIRDGDGVGFAEDSFVDASRVDAAWLSDLVLTPLAETELLGFDAGTGRRWARPPAFGSAWASALGVPDIALDGPGSAAWRLPAGARALSLVVRLGGSLGDPDAVPGRWADAEIEVRVERAGNNEVLASFRVSGDRAVVPVAVDLPGIGEGRRTLVIEVLEGRFGPIQDRVLLRRPFLIGG